MNEAVNLATIGLACDIVGIVFLTNAMVVRKPRRFIQQYFGIEKPQPMRTVLDQLNAKAQIFTGFLALLVGFSLLIAHEVTGPSRELLSQPGGLPPLPVAERVQALLLLGFGVLVATVVLRLGQNAWSQAVLRKLLVEFFTEHRDWNFEKHPHQTREIGELLGVPPLLEDSIGDYSGRVRAALRLGRDDRPRRPAGSSRSGDDALAPVRNVGAGRRA